jgi:putative ABC transport system permease protein
MAIVVVGLAATGGVLGALRRVLALKPAEAMRAAVPAGIGKGLAGVHLRPSTKMIIRGVVGRPVRSALTVVGLAMALPVIVLGLFWWDALDVMVEVQFDGIERGDAVVTFTGPVPERAVREIGALPGVVAAEGLRIVPVRLRAGHRSYRLALTGIAADAELRAPRDVSLRRIPVPVEGLMLSSGLAERLGVYAGSLLSVEVLDGKRPVRNVRVAALVDEVLGFSAYMDIDALGRLLREGDRVSHVALRVDPTTAADVWKLIADRPRVEATSVKKIWLQIFDEQVGGILLISAVVLTLFGIIIAVSVVYNAARVVLQERAWELASLRILGFTRAEVSRLLLAGLAFELLLAVPLGLLFARYIVAGLMALRDNESFTIPPAISSATYASAALVVIAAGLASGLVIRRKVDTLDLVSVLKAKD